jgi:hypothetical protein
MDRAGNGADGRSGPIRRRRTEPTVVAVISNLLAEQVTQRNFTVCDDAAGETCPVWPGNPATAHWGVADPVAVDGDEEHRKRAFHDAAMILKRRIELLLALPLDRLDALSLHHHLKEIGQA